MQNAIEHANSFGGFQGQEILHLFASGIERRLENFVEAHKEAELAFQINPEYGRGYIAQGNNYYDQGKISLQRNENILAQEYFATAIGSYISATSLKDQPYGAFVYEKAETGIGQVYVIQYLVSSKPEYAEQALNSFNLVIESYLKDHETHLKVLAANAYYWSGVIQQATGDLSEAQISFEQVLQLADNEDIISDSQNRLNEIEDMNNNGITDEPQ